MYLCMYAKEREMYGMNEVQERMEGGGGGLLFRSLRKIRREPLHRGGGGFFVHFIYTAKHFCTSLTIHLCM